MNKIVEKINTTIEQNSSGVFNQFITPSSSSDYKERSSKDNIKNFLIGFFIFSVVLTILIVVYAQILSKQIEDKKASLNLYNNNPTISYLNDNFTEINSLSQKLKQVNTVYDSKMYIAGLLFPAIESLVESSKNSYVYFNNFNYKKTQDTRKANVSLSGMAIDYLALYKQIQNFKNNPRIQNLKMGNMNLEKDGYVSFDLSFEMSISPTDYINYINASFSEYLEGENVSGPLFKVEEEEVNKTEGDSSEKNEDNSKNGEHKENLEEEEMGAQEELSEEN